ncbi:MAG: HAD family hydrolase [Lachnospiraceae bacterium]|nr:HAD family hydrolase [Lachnospiraceae bacterium]
MKTLYVTDLDGTLLRSDQTISAYTNETINRLVEQGMLFSYATARSYITARKVAGELRAQIPLIVYNGTFIIDNVSGKLLHGHFFGEQAKEILDDLIAHGIFPIVYAYIDGVEKFSYLESAVTPGMQAFLDTRQGDIRRTAVREAADLYRGDIFYFTCIDETDKLEPMLHKYRDQHHCIYAPDIYSGKQWLEITPAGVSKANAIRRLQKLLGCDRVVVFGDGKNDMDMFEMADECYAVENAAEELKAIATGVIGKNDEDAVAQWLLKNADCK